METSALTAPRLVSVEDGAEDDVFGQLSVTGLSSVQRCSGDPLRLLAHA